MIENKQSGSLFPKDIPEISFKHGFRLQVSIHSNVQIFAEKGQNID